MVTLKQALEQASVIINNDDGTSYRVNRYDEDTDELFVINETYWSEQVLTGEDVRGMAIMTLTRIEYE